MSLGYGLISCQRTAGDPRSWADLYEEALQLAELAEEVGLDSVWTTEHHFVDDGYMPSLLPVAAAMAARTSRITLGTGVVLAPLHHPLRLAEDAATVALLSRGRLELGLGLGWSEIEFEALGADRSKRGRAMDEILEILPEALSGEPFDHRGNQYAFPELGVRPAAEHRVPILLGGHADAALRRAARVADGFFSNARPDDLPGQVAVIRRELERHGRDFADFRWWAYAVVWIADDADEAWAQIRDHLWAMRWKYSDMEASASRSGLAEAPSRDPGWEETGRGLALCGSAQEIADQVNALIDATGVPLRFVARSYFPGMSFEMQTDQMRRLGAELAPLLP